MSEKLHQNIENKPEQEPDKSESYEVPAQKQEKIDVKHEHQEKIQTIREKVGESSKTSEEIAQHHTKHDKTPKTAYKHIQAGSQLQAQALRQNLKKVQKKLPVAERQFSKFIHQPSVEKVSEGLGATVARPSGLLFAGIFSFVSSLVVLTIARYFGYEYNYLVGLASLGGGFVVGLAIEAFSKFIKKLSAR